VDAADAESFARGVALEERMLALRATTYEGLAVKARRAEHYLEYPDLAGLWIESLRRDLEALT